MVFFVALSLAAQACGMPHWQQQVVSDSRPEETQQKRQSLENLVGSGKKQIELGNWSQALALLHFVVNCSSACTINFAAYLSAHILLGEMYFSGGNGVNKNFERARNHFNIVKFRCQKNPEVQPTYLRACLKLGEIYFLGGFGVDRNFVQAEKCFLEVMEIEWAKQKTSEAFFQAFLRSGQICCYLAGGKPLATRFFNNLIDMEQVKNHIEIYAEALYMLAGMFLENRDFDQAMSYINIAVGLQGVSPRLKGFLTMIRAGIEKAKAENSKLPPKKRFKR